MGVEEAIMTTPPLSSPGPGLPLLCPKLLPACTSPKVIRKEAMIRVMRICLQYTARVRIAFPNPRMCGYTLCMHGFLLAALGGVFALVSLIVPVLWPLALLGIAAYVLALTRLSRTWYGAAGYGLAFGLLASAGGVWWFFDVIPLDWLSITSTTVQYYVAGIVYALTVLALALPFALTAPLIRLVPQAWYRPFAIAALLVLAEELRLWSFALFFLGAESTLAPHFSVAALGYTLTEFFLTLPVAQAGHLGLNALLALAGATLAERNWRALVAGTAAVALAIGTAHLTLPSEPSSSEPVRVALIAADIPAGPVTSPAYTLERIKEAAQEGADIVVTPESFGLGQFFPSEARQAFYASSSPDRELLVISSAVMANGDGSERAELLYESSVRGVVATQDKMFFVPVGEYLPPLLQFVIFAAGHEHLGQYPEYIGLPVRRGTEVSHVEHASLSIGALMCSELLSPRLYERVAARGNTDLLINVANNSWFHGSRLLHARLQQIAKTHALHNRQWFLVASNGSPSYAIDARGAVRAESAWGANEILFVEVPR